MDELLAEQLFDGAGQIIDPVAVVDLDAMAVPPAGDRLRIGIATGQLDGRRRAIAATLDITLVPPGTADDAALVPVDDPANELASLRVAAERNPQAVLVLAEVLRSGCTDTAAALDLESFAYSTLLGGTEFARWLESRGPRPPRPPSTRESVRVSRAGRSLHITLNRPERRNAYGREMRDGLVGALRLAALDGELTRVTLDGAGPCFSAGGDLDEFGTAPDPVTAHFMRTRAGAGLLLDRLSERVEVHMHGTCVGAGIELPAFAGTVTARRRTTFRLPEVGMGLIPGAGGTVSLPRRIGRWRTMYLALSGIAIDVTTALDWRLIDAVG